MAIDRDLSTMFHKYLCQKIGTEDIVKTRRRFYTLNDNILESKSSTSFNSGSKSEGLDLKGSDLDVMQIMPNIIVHETLSEATEQNITTFVMDMEKTKPCFTRFRLVHYTGIPISLLSWCERIGEDLYLSSTFMTSKNLQFLARGIKATIHGPCFSTSDESLDVAFSLRCPNWISPAHGWISRSRVNWPSPNVMTKIITAGVLFVPIGCKGSDNDNLEWLISFSTAEKLLIYSFSHTQLLCYGLLKILLKEVISKRPNLQGLLCSYFLKTMLFWVSEEIDVVAVWKPENIIHCFKTCMKRLIYSVEYSMLLHYFIPENNLFENRFNETNKREMCCLLKDLFDQGWRSVSQTETLGNFHPRSMDDTSTSSTISERRNLVLSLLANKHFLGSEAPDFRNYGAALHSMLQFGGDEITNSLHCYWFACTNQSFAQICEINGINYTNKKLYKQYKKRLCYLVLGLKKDAVSGLLMMASSFYQFGNYVTALDLTKYAVSKCTKNKLYLPSESESAHDIRQMTQFVKEEKCITLANVFTLDDAKFCARSSLIPLVLELECQVQTKSCTVPPIVYGHFMKFLCHFHLKDMWSCQCSLQKLEDVAVGEFFMNTAFICLGICWQMIGVSKKADECFKCAVQLEEGEMPVVYGL